MCQSADETYLGLTQARRSYWPVAPKYHAEAFCPALDSGIHNAETKRAEARRAKFFMVGDLGLRLAEFVMDSGDVGQSFR